MRFFVMPALVLIGIAAPARAQGLLLPEDRSIRQPLALLSHHVRITIEEQVAVTRVEQTFHNPVSRQIEAVYTFPVPRGASVNQFSMWVNGKEMRGEMVEAARARQIYTDIVRRTCDPALLEYIGSDVLRLRVFPIPPNGDQKIALSYTTILKRDAGLVDYLYPLRVDAHSGSRAQELSIEAVIRSRDSIQSVYSPTHAVHVSHSTDHEATVRLEGSPNNCARSFQLYYSTSDKELGLALLPHRAESAGKGYFLFLLSPRLHRGTSAPIPRDIVLVLDTSGSMRGAKMEQARRALKYCLDNLDPQDRFAVLSFASTVHTYRDELTSSSKEHLDDAKKWVDGLEANGGTAIDDALTSALKMRPADESRPFTIVFFTDGEPTVGETQPERILHKMRENNTANTRIFTFGVGDDVNATLLDELAEQTRAVSTYVRPAEDIEVKVSSLCTKINHPVLTNLKISTGENIRLDDVYPPQLPDLFEGGQIVVLGRYSGQGSATVTLQGQVGKESREFTYEVKFPEHTGNDRDFVESLWARRKVGYLLDQIRASGEHKELVDETIALAKKYGIATPYTSYLVVPDEPVHVRSFQGMRRAGSPMGGFRPGGGGGIGGGGIGGGGGAGMGPGVGAPSTNSLHGAPVDVALPSEAKNVFEFAQQVQTKKGDLPANRDRYADGLFLGGNGGSAQQKSAYDQARRALSEKRQNDVQSGKLGVDLSIDFANMRNQNQVASTAVRQVGGRSCMEIGGVWIDEGFEAKMAKVVVKAQSDAYFRLLERQPRIRDVLTLGNAIVWVTPSNTVLVIDPQDGKSELSDAEIDQLFVKQ